MTTSSTSTTESKWLRPRTLRPSTTRLKAVTHDRAHHERHAEEQLERDGTADDLGEVGHDDDELGLRPQQQPADAREALGAVLGEALAGDHAELGGEVLDDHRRAAREDDDPHEGVAVLGAGADVDPEVAGVDVGDGREQGRHERARAR